MKPWHASRAVLATLLVLLASASLAQAGQMRLAWDPNPETDIAGYVVSWGTAAGTYQSSFDVGNRTVWDFANAAPGIRYYFVVQAYNTSGLRSNPSLEVSGVAAAPSVTGISPGRLRAGGGNFTLAVYGSGFSTGTTVSWAGSPRPTVVVSASELRVQISSRDVWLPGAYPVTVLDQGREAAPAPVPFMVFGPWLIAGSGSLNDDGMADLVWQSAEGSIAAWMMNGARQTNCVSLWPSPAGVGGWRLATAGDLDGNGSADLIWEHVDGWVAAWLMNGTSQVSTHMLSSAPAAVGGWQVVAAADMNGDGRTDLIWQNDAGWVAAWLMNGVTTSSTKLLDPSPAATNGWRVAGAGDFNGDQKADLLWEHSSGTLAAWLMAGTTHSGSVALSPSTVGAGWRVATTGDLNADGMTDIVWESADGYLAAWLMNRTRQASAVALTPSRVW